MRKINDTAMKLAYEQSAVIIRLDIQFNYLKQIYIGHLTLSNGNEYEITNTDYHKPW